nr:hypothetical protein [bacterium]
MTCIGSAASVYHHANLYPVVVGIGNSPYSSSYVTSIDIGVTSHPVGLKVTVYIFTSQ